MPTITATLQSALPPERVLEAAVDFSQRRSQIFPAVEPEHFTLHGMTGDSADVTEGTGTGIGVSWERCRYDWSQPGQVTATVTDSNVYRTGVWEITAAPSPSGSRVEMTWVRTFKRNPRGLLFGTAFRLVGRPIFRKYAGQIVANLDTLAQPRSPRPTAQRAYATRSDTPGSSGRSRQG